MAAQRPASLKDASKEKDFSRQAFPKKCLFSPRISKRFFGRFVGFQGLTVANLARSAFRKLFADIEGLKDIVMEKKAPIGLRNP